MPIKSKQKAKEYRKRYYQEHKEEMKAYQRERYQSIKEQKEQKAKSLGGNGSPTLYNGQRVDRNVSSFFTVTGQANSSKASANDILRQFNSWVFTCCTINGSSVANQRLRLYAATQSRGEEKKYLYEYKHLTNEQRNYLDSKASLKSLARKRTAKNVVEIVDHPVLDLLDQINDNSNEYETFELTQIYLDMLGDSYWYIVRDSFGVPSEIYLLQSQRVKVVPGKRKLIKGYLYINGYDSIGNVDAIKFRPNEIIHFKTPNPNDVYYGRGAAQSVITAINRMNSMDVSEQARLDNQGRPDFVVNYNGKLDSSEIKKIERMWRGAFGGPNKAGKIKIMDSDFSIKTLGYSPKDMEYLSGRTWSVKEIASAFGVPYSMLDSTDAKKATSEIAERSYAKQAILPRITRIEQKLNEKLIPLYDPTGRLFLAYDNPVPQDRKLMLEENVQYISAGVMTVNEARLRIGMEAFDDEEYDVPKPQNAQPPQLARTSGEENALEEGEDNSD